MNKVEFEKVVMTSLVSARVSARHHDMLNRLLKRYNVSATAFLEKAIEAKHRKAFGSKGDPLKDVMTGETR